MSNIIFNDKKLDLLHAHLDYFRSYGINEKTLNNFLEEFILKDDKGDLLSKYLVDFLGEYLPCYDPYYNIVEIAYAGLMETVEKYYNLFNGFDSRLKFNEDLKNYVCIFVIFHELEHSYQNYLRLGIMEAPTPALKSIYEIIFGGKIRAQGLDPNDDANFIVKFFREYRFLFYDIRRGRFAMERNANVEALDACKKLSALEDNKDLNLLFSELWMDQLMIGYYLNGKGSIIQTAKAVFDYKSLYGLEEIDSLSFDDRIRYGLPITKDELREFFISFNSDLEKQKKIKFLFRL